ncbi:RsmB/NOP family class I SAM-dependent RNA methyltransferase [Kordiimonas sp.]|uniref:RsmB/NOP family class I SAM-dependent RNA methyltransferase n=1 Tax=Kordiimonas sp. TaxID=1970157 RepID=UPI003A8D6E5F
MQPSARIAAGIELLSQIEEAITSGGAPADRLVAEYFRARRYAGSKDRRAVTEAIYAILRMREQLLWALDDLKCEQTARALFILYLQREDPNQLNLFGEEGNSHAPDALSAEENGLLERASTLNCDSAPVHARENIPAWALLGFEKRFGEELPKAAAALNETAPLDVRINRLKRPGDDLNNILKNSSELFEKHVFSNDGYRSISKVNLANEKAYQSGLIEVQDEAAQVAASLVNAQPGMQVVDLCAGAGGKSLAVAPDMENKGQIHAFDISGGRLKELRNRLQRAGCRNIQVTRLAAEGEGRATALSALEGKADRVMVDVPCSGSGTWRRSPDQRWRFDDNSLKNLNKLQGSLLREGAGLVKAGGRLIYMTCSVLPAENEDIVENFLRDMGTGWALADYKTVWAEVLKSECPQTLAFDPLCLQLAPHSHGTDGFFIAVLERAS